jgi:hypothetical protein
MLISQYHHAVSVRMEVIEIILKFSDARWSNLLIGVVRKLRHVTLINYLISIFIFVLRILEPNLIQC